MAFMAAVVHGDHRKGSAHHRMGGEGKRKEGGGQFFTKRLVLG